VAEEEPTADDLLEAFKQVKVADVVMQWQMSLSSLAWYRLSEDGRDLEQAHLAIEMLRATVPLLKEAAAPDLVRDLEQVTANLQLAYAKAVAEPS